MSVQEKKKPIDLRKVVNPNDYAYDFIERIHKFLGSPKNKGAILTFIFDKIADIPIEEFIKIPQK